MAIKTPNKKIPKRPRNQVIQEFGYDGTAQLGISMPNNSMINSADNEMFRRFQHQQMLNNQQVNDGNYLSGNLPDINQGINYQPIDTNTIPRGYNNFQQQQQPNSYNGEYGNAALMGLLTVDALLPNRKQPSQVVRPLNSYNQNPYGTGSRAIAQNGAMINGNISRQYTPITYQEMQQNNNKAINSSDTGSYNSYLNPQQQYFYQALQNPTNSISDIYKGFNQELVGYGSKESRGVNPNNSPFEGTYILNDGDKHLLQQEYLNYKKFKGNNRNYFNDLRKRAATDQRINNLVPAASIALGEYYENGGKISQNGYKSNSPDRNEPYLTIPSNQITMQDVPHPVYGVDNLGYEQIMYPNQEYKFPGNYVREIPLKKTKGKMLKSGGKLPYNVGETYDLSDDEVKSLIAQGYEIKIH